VRALEPALGAVLIALVLADVFLTVLYARMGTGVFSPSVARLTWLCFRGLSRAFGRRRGVVLSLCGPAILVLLVFVWASLLTCGTAMVIHPYMGTSIRIMTEAPPHEFVTALYAAATSVAIVGTNEFVPQTAVFRIYFLFNSLAGLSVLSLTLTYLMQIYIALQRRNTVGLTVYLQTGLTNDAAELVAGLGPGGRFTIGYVELSRFAADVATAKEAHHFYPVLFYFRFNEAYYSVSWIIIVALDTVSLIRTALDDAEYAWLKESGAVAQLWDASLMMIQTLEHSFLPGGVPETFVPQAEVQERWRQRYFAAAQRFRRAGIKTVADEQAGADAYIGLRAQWDNYIKSLAPTMLYRMGDIDPASSRQAGPQVKAA
jgi:hypothetical protein